MKRKAQFSNIAANTSTTKNLMIFSFKLNKPGQKIFLLKLKLLVRVKTSLIFFSKTGGNGQSIISRIIWKSF
jgi:hypothetical protein